MTTTQKVIKYCAVAFAVFLCVSIIGGIVGVLASIDHLFGDNDNSEIGEAKLYQVTDRIETLDIDIGAARLEIKSGSNFEVEYINGNIKIYEKDRTLSISEKGRIFGFGNNDYRVILTIPTGYEFEEVDIDSGAGTVTIDELVADKLFLDLGAGEINIANLVSKAKTEIDGGAGKLTISGGELADLDFDMGVGKVELKSKISGKSEIDCGVGAVDLTLIGDSKDYRISYDKGVGSIEIDGEKMNGDGVYGAGENSISVDGGVGSINIDFCD